MPPSTPALSGLTRTPSSQFVPRVALLPLVPIGAVQSAVQSTVGSVPPSASPRHPRVIPILNPPKRRHQVQRSKHPPPATQLPQHPIDRRRPLKLPPTLLHRPRRPIDLLTRKAERCDQPRLLVAPHHDPPTRRPLHPPRQPRAEFALCVVHQGYPAVHHPPKLH